MKAGAFMKTKRRMGNRILSFMLTLVLLTGGSSFAYGQTSNKESEAFANLVVFVQLDGNPEKNFMETPTTGYNNPSYTQLAEKYWLNADYSKSLTSYLKKISYGQFQVTSYLPQFDGKTITPVMGNGTSDDSLISAVAKGNYRLSGADLDQNHDGYIDNLTIIVQGDNIGDRDSDLYSHKSDYPGEKYIAGKRIYTYNVINSYAAFEHQKESVVFHEFLHSIGFPDLYSYDGETEPVGSWDIMAGAFMYPQYPLAYLRNYTKKWLTIDAITSNKTGLVLVPASESNGNQAYILKTPMSDSEFFVVEYRKKTDPIAGDDLDAKIYGSGLIIYRVNTDVERLSNAGRDKGIVVFAKDISVPAKDKKELAQSFFSAESGRTSFGSKDLTETSNVLSYSDGRNSGIVLKNIGNAGDTISFDVEFTDLTGQSLWKNCGAGGKVDTEADARDLHIATDSKGGLYAAYEKDHIYVKKYIEGTWQSMGKPLNVTQGKIFLYKDVPYLLCNEDNVNYTARLMKYESGSWKIAAVVSNTSAQYIDAAVCSDGIYIGFSKNLSDTKFSYGIKKYDGSGLSTLKEDVANGKLYNMQLTGDKSALYMTMRTMDNSLTIKKIAGLTVTSVPCNLKTNSFTTLSLQGTLYIGISSADGFSVWSNEGNRWKKEGGQLTNGPSIESKLKAYDDSVIAINENQKTNRTKVWALRGGKWEQQGNDVEVKEISAIDLAAGEKNFFAAYINKSGYPIVKCREVGWREDLEPEKPITPPAQKPKPEIPIVKPVSNIRFTKATSTSIRLSWSASTGATGYDVYRASSKAGKYKKVGTTAKKDFTNTKLASGKNYYYKVQAYLIKNKKRYNAAYTGVAAATTLPRKVSMKIPKAGKKRITLKWRKTAGAAGYEIYRATKKTGNYMKVKTASSKASSWSNTKLKRGKRYYYKVRAVRYLSGKKYCGAFSKRVGAKAK